jgi:pyruvate formate lyase activating enzyme
MRIVGYLKTSLIEWPGKISSVIFVPGCNFRCPFCHNRDLVEPERIKGLQEYSEQSILEDLKKRKKWIDGVVITGGEPTLQPDLPEFLAKIKKLGFLTMIQTNGSQPKVIRSLINKKLVDYLTVDLKGNFEDYQKFTGVKNYSSSVKKSLKIIPESGVDFELRTTVVPTLHNESNLLKLAKGIENCRWYLQTFQPKNCLNLKFNKIEPYSRMEMEGFLKLVEKIIPGAKLRD